jgi:predicted amidophosphoribosyltransferase
VLGLKYRNRRQVARHLAGLVVNSIVAGGDHRCADIITWAPTGSLRRHRRGFDQGEVIARLVARQLGLPCRKLLHRTGPERVQTGSSRRERLAGVGFEARPGLEGAHVLVIDDVVTTGATLTGARVALVRAGAASVALYAVAATPSGVGATSPAPVGIDRRRPDPRSAGRPGAVVPAGRARAA